MPWNGSTWKLRKRKRDRRCCADGTTEGENVFFRGETIDKLFSRCASSHRRALRGGMSRTQAHQQIGGFIDGSEERQEGSQETGGQENGGEEADEKSRSQEAGCQEVRR